MDFTDTVCMYPTSTATLSPFCSIPYTFSGVLKAVVASYSSDSHVLLVTLGPLHDDAVN